MELKDVYLGAKKKFEIHAFFIILISFEDPLYTWISKKKKILHQNKVFLFHFKEGLP